MILDKFSLAGRVAIVTGSGRGIGKGIALAFAEAGADVVVLARTVPEIEETAAEIRAMGKMSLAIPTDVRQADQVANLVTKTMEEFGHIDILVNNAGGATSGMGSTLTDIADDEWRVGIDTNLTGAMHCSRAAIPHMLETGGGKIINVTSGFGFRAGRDNFIYTSAKAGLVNFTRALAMTYAPDIQANLIAPGLFPHGNKAMSEFWRGGKYTPMGRLGEDEELGPLVVFLASGLTSYMNGQAIVLDGGGLAGGHAPTGFAPVVPLPEDS